MRCLLSSCILLLFFSGCKTSDKEKKGELKAHTIERLSYEKKWTPPLPQKKELPLYAWELERGAPYSPITKEYFRCRGSGQNPWRLIQKGNRQERLEDCSGSNSHSLPLKNGKEFVYPVLIDLMNYLQDKTGRKVVITAGHRCLKHHRYAMLENQGLSSKHMLGAEAAFYVQGMEYQPLQVAGLLMDYYKECSSEYAEFQRYTKEDIDVSTLPWYNKEIYIKIYKAGEGRDFDNRHPYPYLRVQVRFDRDENKRVLFDWDLAEKNYHH